MKILFNYAEDPLYIEGGKRDYSGVGYYRVIKPYEQVKGHDKKLVGYDVKQYGKTLEEKWSNIFKEFDIYWTFYHCDDKEASAMYYFRDKYKKKVIIDVDDDYLDTLQNHPLYENLKPGKKDKAFISAMLSMADVITCSTEPLAQRLDEHFSQVYGLKKNIVVIPNFNDLKDWNFPLPKKDPNKVVIGYAGSNSHHDDLVMMLPHLAKVMNKHKNVYFETMGLLAKDKIGLLKDFSQDALNRCDIVGSVRMREYPKTLIGRAWDIALAPLAESKFTRCKSHIKWMENAACKVPIIASRVYPYFMDVFGRRTIISGKTGILIKPSEWEKAIEDLVLNKEKREEIGRNAYDFVKNNWQYEDSNLDSVLDEIFRVI